MAEWLRSLPTLGGDELQQTAGKLKDTVIVKNIVFLIVWPAEGPLTS
jgi:hypothetical protein